jgi:hypothetical protein
VLGTLATVAVEVEVLQEVGQEETALALVEVMEVEEQQVPLQYTHLSKAVQLAAAQVAEQMALVQE